MYILQGSYLEVQCHIFVTIMPLLKRTYFNSTMSQQCHISADIVLGNTQEQHKAYVTILSYINI